MFLPSTFAILFPRIRRCVIRSLILGLQSIFNHISCIGISLIKDTHLAKQVIFTNRIALTFILVSIPFESLLFGFGYSFLGLIALPFIAMYGFCFALNHYRQFLLAQITLFLGVIIPTYLYTYFLGTDSGIQNVYFICVACAFGLFTKKQRLLKLIFSIIPILLFYSIFFIAAPNNPSSGVLDKHLIYIHFLSVSIIFIILFMSGKFYTDLAEKYKTQNNHLLKIYGLTNREGEIITHIVSGKSNKEIASLIFIEEGTVKNHLHNIFSKTKVKSRLELSSLVRA